MFVAWSIVNSSDKVGGICTRHAEKGRVYTGKETRVGRYSGVEKGVVMDNQ